jgi:hypothetical protein
MNLKSIGTMTSKLKTYFYGLLNVFNEGIK